MKTCSILVLFCCSLPALALTSGMQTATVHAMRKVPCEQAPDANRLAALSGLVGSGVSGVPSETGGDCVEYELRTERVSYIIRPRHPILLLLGGNVSIKLANSELLLRTSESSRDIRCAVLAMSLRPDAEKSGPRERNRSTPVRCYEGGHEFPCPDES